jgi:indolepyruvate ferredoxin oxidoreductase, beta subunit
MSETGRPLTFLIAALGGEGGGVLTGWIIAAAASQDLPVQSTSIPGVAQRTGATTYYIEIFPRPWRELDGKRPVMALSPGIGDVDVVVASELLEAARTVAAGFVTPDRTLAIASTHRHGSHGPQRGRHDQRGDARRDRRIRAPAGAGRGLRSGDPRRREGGRGQSARLCGRARGGAGTRWHTDRYIRS